MLLLNPPITAATIEVVMMNASVWNTLTTLLPNSSSTGKSAFQLGNIYESTNTKCPTAPSIIARHTPILLTIEGLNKAVSPTEP